MARDSSVDRKEGSALGVSIGTRMLVEPAGMGDRFKTEFIGMLRGQFIIVRIPRIPGLNDYLYVEKKITVRYVHEGNVYGFESEVVWNQQAPFRLLFLRYPTTVEILNLRKCQRVDCYLPVTIGMEEGGQFTEYQGMMLNLSCGGCQLVLDSKQGSMPPVSVDALVSVAFRMFGTNKDVRLEGKAKNINVNKNRMYMGVMYSELPSDVSEGIDNYVSNVAEYLES
ncbi:flagellar brake protein [Desulfovibrio ferrophilus]|uniref:Type IV pilus assembly PilZ n=1 Tax=Desulfovibrio ferrophilus TaxID=241368 RepID=A0A2Z6AU06_9BACT|nr:flagellar brake protein [Desulfovibrio ferrophilus]BBD06733.1 type IV pilus assembly PilZ [Desulfovibrio ferrophilus]